MDFRNEDKKMKKISSFVEFNSDDYQLVGY